MADETRKGERVQSLRELPARMREVLLCVVGEYIATGQAVGSQAALRLSDLDVSAATVRASMSELMEAGLLAQSHASAGRRPTDAAFRLWVDYLLGEPEGARPLPLDLGEPGGDLDDYLRHAADLLSQATGQLGFLVGPRLDQQHLERVQFVRVSHERVMALLVSGSRMVRTRLIEESESDQRALDRVSTRLSAIVAGQTLEQARRKLHDELRRERSRGDAAVRAWRKLSTAGLRADDAPQLYVADRTALLGQPEFSDVEQARRLLSTLEEKERMLRLLDKIVRADDLRVVIGEELDDPDVRSCAVVTARLGDSPPIGGIGVIGPVRMRYDRVIPLVRGVSERVGAALV